VSEAVTPGTWLVDPTAEAGKPIRIVLFGARKSDGALAKTCPSTMRTHDQDLANASMMAASKNLYLAMLTLVEEHPCHTGRTSCACPTCMGWKAIREARG